MKKICKYCEKEFETENKKQVYCSLKCKDRYEHNISRDHTPGICKRCGKPFEQNTPRRKYCSGECSKLAAREREKAQRDAKAVPADVRMKRYERKANAYCKGCKHWKSLAVGGNPKYCDFLCDVGRPRDCEPLNCKYHTKRKGA